MTQEKQIQLTKDFLLMGFNSESEMTKWIQQFNSMDGDDAPPPFDECCAYEGLAQSCEPKEEWLEKDGVKESGGYWWKPYDSNKYCYNHHRWAFESALRVIGNPPYIIIINQSKQQ